MILKESQVVLRRAKGEVSAEVRRGKGGQLIVKTENIFLLPLMIMEVLTVAVLIALNYCFRFDPTIRFKTDMVNYSNIRITCDKTYLTDHLSRPYFDYSASDEKSFQGLELQYDLPEWIFFLCVILVPIPIFCIIEGIRAWYPGKKRKEVVSFGYVIPQYARRIPRIVCGYIVGGCLTGIFISIFKFNITSPRPHFMNVCFNHSNSFPKSCNSSNFFWKPTEECDSGVSSSDVVEALKSFPSYHAAVSLYCGIFTMSYIGYAAKIRSFYTGSLLILLSLSVMTMLGATHRLSSGHSFPIDVLMGALLGLLCSMFVIHVTFNRFKERKWKLKICDTIPHNEENMLPLKTIKHVPVLDVQTQDEYNSTKATDESSSSESDEDYDKIVAKIDKYQNRIPRATINMTKQPTQAINKNLNSNFENDENKGRKWYFNDNLQNRDNQRFRSSHQNIATNKPQPRSGYNQPFHINPAFEETSRF